MKVEDRRVRRKKIITALMIICVVVMFYSIFYYGLVEQNPLYPFLTVTSMSLMGVLVLAHLLFSTKEKGEEQSGRDTHFTFSLLSASSGKIVKKNFLGLSAVDKFIVVMFVLFISGAVNYGAKFLGYTDFDSYSSFVLALAAVTFLAILFSLLKKSR